MTPSILIIVQFVLAILLTIVVLLQKSSSIGLGAYSGSNESLFGAKGPGNFLTKLTMVLGLLFVINTVTLGYLFNEQRNKSAIDTIAQDAVIPQSTEKVKATAPAAPSVPTVPAESTTK